MTPAPQQTQKDLFYNGFASEFDAKMNMYDTLKRVRLMYTTLLPERLDGRYVLDAGCGTGWFSRGAVERGGRVVSLDVGENLLREVAKKVETERVVGSIMELKFPDETFDVVVSSEVIEHTPDPHIAFGELARVLKKGGILALTTPNRVWYPSVVIADALKLRPYEGNENWVYWRDLQAWCREYSLKLELMIGFHLLPFQVTALHPVIDYCDRFGKGWLGHLMINVGLRAVKQ